MNRAEKAATVERMNQAFQQTPHVIVASFRGLSVNQATELRRKIRAAGGSYKVVKNRLAKRAAQDTAVEKLAEHLNGPCAIASHETDPVSLAKALWEFAKDNPQLELVAGVVDAKGLLDAEGIRGLSRLPGLPGLRTWLLSLIQSPTSALVRLLHIPSGRLARVIDARREKLGSGGEG